MSGINRNQLYTLLLAPTSLAMVVFFAWIVLPKSPEVKHEYAGIVIENPEPLANAARQPQGFVPLEFRSLPNMNVNIAIASRYKRPFDKDSVEMFRTPDGIAHYHPVGMIHRILQFIGAYVKTNDAQFMRRAETYMRRLIALGERHDHAILLPYNFSIRVHQKAQLALEAPWYSAMAQGEFLSVCVRMFELTGDSTYLGYADSAFVSLSRLQFYDKPWVSRIDTAGYLWLEEYPLEYGPDQTLNGFVAAVYGVYDYYRVTNRKEARQLWDACLSTIKHYLPAYRNPGSNSYYCLGHGKVADSSYHQLHCSMMNELFRMSGDSLFLATAREFQADAADAQSRIVQQ